MSACWVCMGNTHNTVYYRESMIDNGMVWESETLKLAANHGTSPPTMTSPFHFPIRLSLSLSLSLVPVVLLSPH